jgi:periplasmic protein TonB
MKIFTFIMLLLQIIVFCSYGQEKIYTVVDKQAEFKGGAGEMFRFISKNFKYPDSLYRTGITCGKILISFIIKKDGSTKYQDCKCGCPPLCLEAKKVIEKMPKWEPAKNKGKKVKSLYTLPIWVDLE